MAEGPKALLLSVSATCCASSEAPRSIALVSADWESVLDIRTLGSLLKEYAACRLNPRIVADTSVNLRDGVILRFSGASFADTSLSCPLMTITQFEPWMPRTG